MSIAEQCDFGYDPAFFVRCGRAECRRCGPTLRAVMQSTPTEVERLRAALKEALDGWAVWVTPGALHPERPDSITDAEICDMEKIAKLRKLLP